MRKKLKNINDQRLRFIATVERFGTKSAFRGPPTPTVLLKDIQRTDTAEIVADHLWFTKGKSWDSTTIGCQVEFDARVSSYEKGYKGYRDDVLDAPVAVDYRLERPTRVVVLSPETGKTHDELHSPPSIE